MANNMYDDYMIDKKKDSVKMKVYVLDEMIKRMGDIEGEKMEEDYSVLFPKEKMKMYADRESEHMSSH